MAQGDINLFDQFRLKQNNGEDTVDFDTDVIRLMFVKSTYTPDYATHNFISEIESDEVIPGTTYSAKGPQLGGVTLSLVGGFAIFDADDLIIAMDGSGFTDARYIIFYKDTGVSATSRVIALGDLGADRSVQDGAFNLNWNVSGIFRF